jgi:hypothetical protein
VKYSLDASSIIAAWTTRYPIDVMPTFWENLDSLIDNGDLRATEEVYEEIKRKDDGLFRWIRPRSALIVPVDEPVQEAVREILGSHRYLVEMARNRSGADPFVIGLARVHGVTVMTEERMRPNPVRKPKIPDVCGAYRIPCINLLGLIRANGWVYR